jgi:hypothetical protein
VREINPEPESKAYEIRHYADDHGRRVQEFIPVQLSATPGVVPRRLTSDAAFIRGQAQVMSNTPQGPRQLCFDFQFPPEVINLGQAFACFDDVVKSALAEVQRQQQQQRDKEKQEGP